MDDINIIWDTLEKTIVELEGGQHDFEIQAETAMAGIILLMEHPVEAIFEKLEESRYPTRALVAWLVYEGQKTEFVDPLKLKELMAYWKNRQAGMEPEQAQA